MADAVPFPQTTSGERSSSTALRVALGAVHLLMVLAIGYFWSKFLAVVYAIILIGVLIWRNRARFMRYKNRSLAFTSEGKYAIGITVGVGIAAINTGNNLLYLFLGMLLSLIVISGILSELTLRQLSVERKFPAQIFARRAFLTQVSVINEKQRTPSYSVQVEDHVAQLEKSKKCFFLKISPQARQQTSYRTVLDRRGVYAFEQITLVTRFPFSLFVKRRVISKPDQVLVFPAILPVSDLVVLSTAVGDDQAVSQVGAGQEFHGLREYQPGDDARNIHWGRSAGHPALLVREFSADAAPTTLIGLNPTLTESVRGDVAPRIERCVEYAASLTSHYVSQGHDVRFLLPEREWHVRSSGQGLDALLRALATLDFEHVDRPQTWSVIPDIVVTLAEVASSVPSHAEQQVIPV